MKWKNTTKTWGITTQLFHWGMLLIILFQYSLALAMVNIPDSDQKWTLYGWHKEIGVTLLFLVILRFWWREMNPIPKDSPKAPKWDHYVSKANIWLLYAFMFILPLSGFFMSVLGGHAVNYFDLFTFPSLMEGPNQYAKFLQTVHIWSAYLTMVFVSLHILGAVYHHFFIKDDILLRMLPKRE